MSGASIEIVGFGKANGSLSKQISLHDGKVVSDGSACTMASGCAVRVVIDGLEPFAELIESLDSREAIALGRLNRDLPDRVEVVTKSKLSELNGQAAPNVIARIGSHISYAAGEPALVLIDVDTKGMPPAVAEVTTDAGGYWEAMLRVLPGLASAARVTRRSTSTGIYHTKTGERYRGQGECTSSSWCRMERTLSAS